MCGGRIRQAPEAGSSHRARINALAIRTTAVEVDEDFSRLGAVAGSDNPPVLQLVHDACGASITDLEPPLK